MKLREGELWSSVGSTLLSKAPDSYIRSQIQLILQELVRVDCLNIILRQRIWRKVPKVGGHNQCSVATDCRRRHVPIFWIVCHCGYQRNIAFDCGVRESRPHVVQSSARPLWRDSELVVDQIPFNFGQDLLRPQRLIQVGLVQPK